MLRPTLGPVSGVVAIAGATGTSTPEVLNNAAVIARRTIQLDDPFQDMGAMLVRQLAWGVYEDAGDGAASAAVICREIVRLAHLHVAAGGDPMALKRGLERGLPLALNALREQMREVQLPGELARMVAGTLHEPELARMIGEITETVGAAGAIRIEDGNRAETVYDYVQGSRWESGCLSSSLLPEVWREAILESPRILVADSNLTAADVLHVLELCLAANVRSLLIIAPALSDAAIALLNVNRERGVMEGAIAVKAPAYGPRRHELLEDIAVITGSRCIRGQAEERVSNAGLRDLGTARQVWATRQTFGLLGGGGDRSMIRHRVGEAKNAIQASAQGDAARHYLEGRIGNLMGASAIIRVGAPTSTARKELRSRIESAAKVARSASSEGGVPGGGAAYVGCVPVLDRLRRELVGDEAQGVSILIRALFAPIRTIAQNAGFNPNVVEDRASRCCPGSVFDAERNAWVDPWKAGIIDPLPVVLKVLEASTSTAMMALTTDVLVRRKTPIVADRP
ncbi:MAG: hypothetical protein M3457_01685 [Chloroflexota bacterium]|nr:hypothetical protein [Chloroflexota bacterium]